MLILECSQGCYGRKDGSVTISLRNFVCEGIKIVETEAKSRPPNTPLLDSSLFWLGTGTSIKRGGVKLL